MPKPFQHRVNRVTIYGTSYGGQEIWTTGFFMGSEVGDATIPNESMAQAVKDAWTTFFRDTGNTISYLWKTEGVKISPMLANGDTDKDFVVTSPYTTAIEGQSSSTGFPAQVSLVATLLAGNGRGLAGKGRMYLPGIAIPLAGTGHLAVGQNSGVATKLATFFNTIESSFDGGQVINASHGRAPFLGSTAVNRYVSHIRVGDVYDTQRRRRNSLVESYATAALA